MLKGLLKGNTGERLARLQISTLPQRFRIFNSKSVRLYELVESKRMVGNRRRGVGRNQTSRNQARLAPQREDKAGALNFNERFLTRTEPLCPGARGIGEIGLAGVAAAITAAVHHATGVRVRELPVKIEDLLV